MQLPTRIQRQDMASNPYSRGHQEKILRFREELSCISTVLNDQVDVVRDLPDWTEYNKIGAPWHLLEKDRSYALTKYIGLTELRIRSILEMDEDANKLASWVRSDLCLLPSLSASKF